MTGVEETTGVDIVRTECDFASDLEVDVCRQLVWVKYLSDHARVDKESISGILIEIDVWILPLGIETDVAFNTDIDKLYGLDPDGDDSRVYMLPDRREVRIVNACQRLTGYVGG